MPTENLILEGIRRTRSWSQVIRGHRRRHRRGARAHGQHGGALQARAERGGAGDPRPRERPRHGRADLPGLATSRNFETCRHALGAAGAGRHPPRAGRARPRRARRTSRSASSELDLEEHRREVQPDVQPHLRVPAGAHRRRGRRLHGRRRSSSVAAQYERALLRRRPEAVRPRRLRPDAGERGRPARRRSGGSSWWRGSTSSWRRSSSRCASATGRRRRRSSPASSRTGTEARGRLGGHGLSGEEALGAGRLLLRDPAHQQAAGLLLHGGRHGLILSFLAGVMVGAASTAARGRRSQARAREPRSASSPRSRRAPAAPPPAPSDLTATRSGSRPTSPTRRWRRAPAARRRRRREPRRRRPRRRRRSPRRRRRRGSRARRPAARADAAAADAARATPTPARRDADSRAGSGRREPTGPLPRRGPRPRPASRSRSARSRTRRPPTPWWRASRRKGFAAYIVAPAAKTRPLQRAGRHLPRPRRRRARAEPAQRPGEVQAVHRQEVA